VGRAPAAAGRAIRETSRVPYDHEHDVAKFRTESQSAQDPDVKSFAAKTLPTLAHHLEMAKEVSARTGSATSGAGANRD
jgi:Domain of unknown function (DUF4142)